MAGLKFSILLPTRERAATLGPSIETCLAQNYDNLEILVSDNASSPATRAVVESFSDKRLKYFRQDKGVSMRENYEFITQKATGDYIILIGDDDGMMPNAIPQMAEFLSQNPVDVLNWNGVVYNWPNRLIKDRGFVVLKYQKVFGALTFVDIRDRLESFVSGETQNYLHGCNFYHGCVSRQVIEELRNKTGQVFGGHLPDVYVSMALLYAAKSMAYFNHPLTITGISPASIGFSYFTDVTPDKKTTEKPTPHQVFSTEANNDAGLSRPFNSQLRASQYYAAMALMAVNDIYKLPQKLDVDRWAKISIEEAKGYCDLHAVKDSLDPAYELDKKMIDLISSDKSIIPGTQPPHNPAGKLSEKFNRLMIDTNIGGRDTVMTAFQNLEKIFDSDGIRNRNFISRFFAWLDLKKRYKPFSFYKS
jgi:glycosyltransferase involved in cell wall biosynthesis